MSNRSSLLACVILLAFGCATNVASLKPEDMVCPQPINGNSGKFMCPFTQDDVMAEWVDKAVSAKLGAAIGKTAGTYAGRKVAEKLGSQVPIVGGWLGSKAGEAAGRQVAIGLAGGMKHIKETSDLSFNSLEDMSIYLYKKCSSLDHYQEALQATFEIYPEFAAAYPKTLARYSIR